MVYVAKPAEERFWSKVQKTDTCWLWTAYCFGDGYGELVKPGGKGYWRTHRFSWELHNGPIPEGLEVLHTCDVPRCVNPDHLFLGTQEDNRKDQIAKGRSHYPRPGSRGDNNWQRREIAGSVHHPSFRPREPRLNLSAPTSN